jgi:hypothetical protein
MLSQSIGESAIPTGVFLPIFPRRDEKIARLRATIDLYELPSGDLAAALIRRAVAGTRRSDETGTAGTGSLPCYL